MFKNYLTTAFRNIVRNKGYSFINIFGLAVGIACCILIFLDVYHERSYDRYHPDYERIYRVVIDIRSETSNRVFAPIAFPVAPALKKDYPQVEYVGRLSRLGSGLVLNESTNTAFYENNLFLADQEVFNIFSVPFLKGNPEQALVRPLTLVISERMALKYFGNDDPIGKVLKIDDRNYAVTGVVENPPGNTHWKYDFMISLVTISRLPHIKNWHGTQTYTYVKLRPGVDAADFEEQCRSLADKYVGEELRTMGVVYRFFLQPLADIHLYSNLRYEMESPGSSQMITISITIGLLVLLIACINFINLATARSINRAREVGVRKAVGGRKTQLILQFVGESFLVTLFAFIVALVFAALVIPVFNNLLGIPLSFSTLFQPGMVAVMVGLLLFIGLTAGIYPAFILSGFKPALVLKASRSSGTTKSPLRRVLVVLQFSISIILIVMTIGVHKQLSFMKRQDLGFDKERKLVVRVKGRFKIGDKYEAIKERYLKHPGILNAAASSTVPGRGMINFAVKLVGEENDRNQSMYHLYFDPDFLPNYSIETIAGRAFQREMGTDKGKTCMINRSAARALGVDSPEQAVGKIVQTGKGSRNLRVIGVVENFHFRGLQHNVEPVIMEWLPGEFDNLTFTVNTENLEGTLAFAKETWAEFFPGFPFEYFFLDEDFDRRQYRIEELTGKIFGAFSILGQLIACLGLVGLAAFITRQRTREIGIRKVVGASIASVTFLITREFLKWVVLANIIAWPAAYFAMDRWLSGFAYRAPMGIWPFIAAGLLALFIALLTVGYQAVRAAAANPVKAIRYE